MSDDSRQNLFKNATACGFSDEQIAHILSKHIRTIKDWKKGKYSIDCASFQKLLQLTNTPIDSLAYEEIDISEQKRKAGRIGGIKNYEKNGNFGTKEDKKKGGITSYAIQKSTPGNIFSKNEISLPNENYDLAEFFGVCMGDGSITKYQVTISLNSTDDKAYIKYASTLGNKIFNLQPSLVKKSRYCTNVVFNGVNLVEFLTSKGLPKGDKIRNGLDIPEWIRCDRELSKACIRGLFDTDGSVYLETHNRNRKKYSYPRMSFVSASEGLLHSVCEVLQHEGIGAKIRGNRSVTIERFTDIKKYFKIIGSSNQKHLDRFAR